MGLDALMAVNLTLTLYLTKSRPSVLPPKRFAKKRTLREWWLRFGSSSMFGSLNDSWPPLGAAEN
jgi:hypothetical protein